MSSNLWSASRVPYCLVYSNCFSYIFFGCYYIEGLHVRSSQEDFEENDEILKVSVLLTFMRGTTDVSVLKWYSFKISTFLSRLPHIFPTFPTSKKPVRDWCVLVVQRDFDKNSRFCCWVESCTASVLWFSVECRLSYGCYRTRAWQMFL